MMGIGLALGLWLNAPAGCGAVDLEAGLVEECDDIAGVRQGEGGRDRDRDGRARGEDPGERAAGLAIVGEAPPGQVDWLCAGVEQRDRLRLAPRGA